MTATFDATAQTDKDWIRRQIGDAIGLPDGALRQDEEIYAVLVRHDGDKFLAMAELAAGLAVEFAEKPDSFSESGGVSVRWGERVKQWNAVALIGRTQAALSTSGMAVSLATTRGGDDGTSEYVRETWFTG